MIGNRPPPSAGSPAAAATGAPFIGAGAASATVATFPRFDLDRLLAAGRPV